MGRENTMKYYILEGNYLFSSLSDMEVDGSSVSGILLNTATNESKIIDAFVIGKAFIAKWEEIIPEVEYKIIEVASADSIELS